MYNILLSRHFSQMNNVTPVILTSILKMAIYPFQVKFHVIYLSIINFYNKLPIFFNRGHRCPISTDLPSIMSKAFILRSQKAEQRVELFQKT
jgi:hypothetical protein